MPLEAIGLEAVLRDENFQAGVKRYVGSLGTAESKTTETASVMTKLSGVASGALTVGLGVATAAVGAATVALGAVATVSKAGLDSLLSWGEQLDRLGDQFGATGEQASIWAYAMNRVGVSVEEGGAMLNFFTKQLDNVKTAGVPAGVVLKDNSKAVEAVKDQLAAAQKHLQRVTITMQESKKPTQQMTWALEDAKEKVAKLQEKLAGTPKVLSSMPKEVKEKLSPFQIALESLGVSAFDAKGKLKSFDDLMPDIMDAFNKLPSGVQASALAMDLFGARGGTKFLDFLRSGSAGLTDAAKRAKELGLVLSTDGVNAIEEYGFTMNELNLAFTGVKNQIGAAVLPYAKQFTEWVVSIMPKIVELSKVIAAKLGSAFEVFANLAKYFGFVVDEGDYLNDFLSNLPKGIQPIAESIGKLISAFKEGGIKGLIAELGIPTDIIVTFKDMFNTAKELWPQLQEIGRTTGKEVAPVLKELAAEVLPYVVDQLKEWGAWFKDNGPAIITFFKTGAKGFKLLLQAVLEFWKIVKPIFKIWQDLFRGELSIAMKLLAGDWKGAWNDMQKTAKKVWAEIEKALKSFFDNLDKTIVRPALEAIKKFVEDKLNEIKKKAEDAWNDIKTKAKEIWRSIGEAIKNAIDDIDKKVKDGLETVRKTALAIWNFMFLDTGEKWNLIKGKIDEILGKIKTAVETELNKLKDKMGDIWQGIVDAARVKWEELVTTITTFIRDLPTRVNEAVASLIEIGRRIIKAIGDGIVAAWEAAGNIVDILKDKLSKLWEYVWSGKLGEDLAKIGASILTAIGDGLKAAWDGVNGLWQTLWRMLSNLWENLQNLDLKAVGDQIINSIIAGIQYYWNNFVTWLKDAIVGIWDDDPDPTSSRTSARPRRTWSSFGSPAGTSSYSIANASNVTMNLYVSTSAPVSTVVQDFGMMRALAGV